MVTFTRCPEDGCHLDAVVLRRTVLESTDGPIEHVMTVCPNSHGFFLPVEMLTG